MKRPALLVLSGVLAVTLAYGAYRLFLHSRALLEPAVVTKTMDVHRALSPSVGARVDRLLHEHVDKDRTDRKKLVALTFDDGPYPVSTPLLLDVLRDLKVKATFFYIGRDAELYPELTSRTQREGHEIANHTLTHPNLDQLSSAAVAAELRDGAKMLHRFSTDPAIDKYFRPPHGRYTEETMDVAQGLGYDVILWSDDGGDWRTVAPAELAAHLEAHATAPEIVLLHSGRLPTIAMLPEVVARMRSAGYEFVTVGELMGRVPAEQMNHPAKHAI